MSYLVSQDRVIKYDSLGNLVYDVPNPMRFDPDTRPKLPDEEKWNEMRGS